MRRAPLREPTDRCRTSCALQASNELQQLLGLNAEENLVEQFACKLLQTYACAHNTHTPAIQVRVHTDQHRSQAQQRNPWSRAPLHSCVPLPALPWRAASVPAFSRAPTCARLRLATARCLGAQMAFQGTLFVTDKHVCFSVEERGRKLPFKVCRATERQRLAHGLRPELPSEGREARMPA